MDLQREMGWGLRNGLMRGTRLRMAWEGGRAEDRFGHEKAKLDMET